VAPTGKIGTVKMIAGRTGLVAGRETQALEAEIKRGIERK